MEHLIHKVALNLFWNRTGTRTTASVVREMDKPLYNAVCSLPTAWAIVTRCVLHYLVSSCFSPHCKSLLIMYQACCLLIIEIFFFSMKVVTKVTLMCLCRYRMSSNELIFLSCELFGDLGTQMPTWLRYAHRAFGVFSETVAWRLFRKTSNGSMHP